MIRLATGAVILLALAACDGRSPATSGPPASSEAGGVCTMEAKQCPDGSYVGRVPPRCEFAPCPGRQ
jgi:hypothetical protein